MKAVMRSPKIDAMLCKKRCHELWEILDQKCIRLAGK